MICPKCQNENPDWVKFCTFCGYKFGDAIEEKVTDKLLRPRIAVATTGKATLYGIGHEISFSVDRDFDFGPSWMEGNLCFRDEPSKTPKAVSKDTLTAIQKAIDQAKARESSGDKISTDAPTNIAGKTGILPRGITKISFIDCDNVETQGTIRFVECHLLKEFDLGKLDTSCWKSLSRIFYDCRSLTELDLSGMNTAGASDTREMFFDCSLLKYLNLDHWQLMPGVDNGDMFKGCNSLRGVSMRGCDDVTVSIIQDAINMAGLSEQVEIIR